MYSPEYMDDQEKIGELTQRLQHEVNCLSDENRGTRRRALEKICKQWANEHKTAPPSVQRGLLEFLLKPLLKVFSDPVEKCRELSITFIQEYLPLTTDIDEFLPYLIPVVVARLGTQEIVEPSEEIRLSLVSLLTSVVTVSASRIAPYLSDLVTILQRTLVDPYPEVKKESCVCSTELAKAIPTTFHQQSENLAKPLFISMTHQHSKVRLACVKALGATIQYGSPKPLDDGLPTLAQRACDSTPSVRACLAEVVGNWLLDLPDRYSYHYKLVPLLFTCMSDEVQEIKNQAHSLWVQIGAKYQLENEEELKDQIDFMQPLTPAPFLEFPRPSLGCRVLIYRCFSKILPAILRDLTDWTAHSRIKSSQLLYTLLFHLEDRATHHVQAIINALYKACQDEEVAVTDQALLCCKVLGYYISPEVWCTLVIPAVRTSAGCRVSGTQQASTVAVGPVQSTGCLKVLVGLLQGCKPDPLLPHLQSVVDCLSEPEVGHSEHLPLLSELLEAVLVTTQQSGQDCHKYSLKLFTVILRVSASSHTQALKTKIEEAFASLAETQSLKETSDLYFNHSKDVVTSLKADYKNWSSNSVDCYMFGCLLSGAGPVLGQILDDIIPILTYCLNSEEPELRLHFITLLIRLLLNAPSTFNSEKLFSKFATRVVADIIVPNLIWKAGRTAAAIRTAAMTCLQALLQIEGMSEDTVDELTTEVLQRVMSCLDDDNQSTRLVSCKVLRMILLHKPRCVDVDKLHTLYCDLLKRLDDSSDAVRIATTQTLMAYLQAFPDTYDSTLYRAHIEALYKGLLIHLDDPSPDIQEAVLAVLKVGARLNSSLLREQVEAVKDKHRERRWCEEVLRCVNEN